MAEDKNSAAQNKLGELFVDIGSSGLGTLVKGLNTLSASFLLTKNAATQFTKPLINMSKTAAQGVIGLDKISAVTGMTVEELQRLQVWTKLNNVSFGDFIGQLQNAQQKILDVRAGMAEAPAGLSRLGLTAFDFDPKDPVGFLNQIMGKVTQLDSVTAAAALRWLGLSEDLLYTWQQGNQVFDERLLLNEQELNTLREQQASWNILGVTVEKALAKWIADQGWLNDGLNELAGNTDKVYEGINLLGTAVKNFGISLQWVYRNALKPAWELTVKLFELIGSLNAVSGGRGFGLFGGPLGNLWMWHGIWKNNKDKREFNKKLDNLTPEQRKKYDEIEKQQEEYNKKLQEQAKKAQQTNKTKKTPPKMNYNPTKNSSTSATGSTNNFGVMGSQLLTPVDDFSAPATVNTQLPPLPPNLQNNNTNNISFQINQTITGDNPEQIAAASADAIDEASLNILQAQNQWAV